jgi:hypothetical protein
VLVDVARIWEYSVHSNSCIKLNNFEDNKLVIVCAGVRDIVEVTYAVNITEYG